MHKENRRFQEIKEGADELDVSEKTSNVSVDWKSNDADLLVDFQFAIIIAKL